MQPTEILYGNNMLDLCKNNHLGDNYIQNFDLGRYIVGFMVGNFVLLRLVSGAVKRNFRPNENFEYGYPHSNALFNIYSSKTHYLAANVSSSVTQKTTMLTNHKRRYS